MSREWTLEEFSKLAHGRRSNQILEELGLESERVAALVAFGFATLSKGVRRDENGRMEEWDLAGAIASLGISMFALGAEFAKKTLSEEVES